MFNFWKCKTNKQKSLICSTIIVKTFYNTMCIDRITVSNCDSFVVHVTQSRINADLCLLSIIMKRGSKIIRAVFLYRSYTRDSFSAVYPAVPVIFTSLFLSARRTCTIWENRILNGAERIFLLWIDSNQQDTTAVHAGTITVKFSRIC